MIYIPNTSKPFKAMHSILNYCLFAETFLDSRILKSLFFNLGFLGRSQPWLLVPEHIKAIFVNYSFYSNNFEIFPLNNFILAAWFKARLVLDFHYARIPGLNPVLGRGCSRFSAFPFRNEGLPSSSSSLNFSETILSRNTAKDLIYVSTRIVAFGFHNHLNVNIKIFPSRNRV
jgi:hypothetical protein